MLVLEALGDLLCILNVVAEVAVAGKHVELFSGFSIDLKNCDALPCRWQLMLSQVLVMMLRISEIISEGLGTAVTVKVNGDPDIVKFVKWNWYV